VSGERKVRLVGTYPREGTWVTVGVEAKPRGSENEPGAHVVLERSERPGTTSVRVRCELGSYRSALRHAEALVLCRGGLLGVDASCMAGSPVERRQAERMFTTPELWRYVHLPGRRDE